jgi:predicted 2-oxoglutarate/Fe(II)-dependent dioxygenase YbiX
MNLNLETYILKINNFIDDELCEKIIQELKKCEWKTHVFYNQKTNEYTPISGEQELEMTFDNIKYNDIVIEKLWGAIKKYIDTINFPWFSGWNGYSKLKFNKYSNNKKMEEHCDHISDIFPHQPSGVPILSMVGSLNNDYKGGEFIMFKNKKIEINSGDLIIFPSNFLYPHKVTLVTEGTRYSFVSWVY